jgi:hypothetical protein
METAYIKYGRFCPENLNDEKVGFAEITSTQFISWLLKNKKEKIASWLLEIGISEGKCIIAFLNNLIASE